MLAEELRHLKDEELIVMIHKDHEHRYFSILYDRYYLKVLDKCFGLLKNRSHAEEFAEDIFSKIFEKIISGQQITSFSSWLYSVTYNHCIDYLRQKKKLHYPEWNSTHEIPEIADTSPEDYPEIDYDHLLEILEMIHPEEKALLMMKYLDNLSIRQIGDSLRISEDAAKMRLKRARTRVLYLYKAKFLNNLS